MSNRQYNQRASPTPLVNPFLRAELVSSSREQNSYNTMSQPKKRTWDSQFKDNSMLIDRPQSRQPRWLSSPKYYSFTLSQNSPRYCETFINAISNYWPKHQSYSVQHEIDIQRKRVKLYGAQVLRFTNLENKSDYFTQTIKKPQQPTNAPTFASIFRNSINNYSSLLHQSKQNLSSHQNVKPRNSRNSVRNKEESLFQKHRESKKPQKFQLSNEYNDIVPKLRKDSDMIENCEKNQPAVFTKARIPTFRGPNKSKFARDSKCISRNQEFTQTLKNSTSSRKTEDHILEEDSKTDFESDGSPNGSFIQQQLIKLTNGGNNMYSSNSRYQSFIAPKTSFMKMSINSGNLSSSNNSVSLFHGQRGKQNLKYSSYEGFFMQSKHPPTIRYGSQLFQLISN